MSKPFKPKDKYFYIAKKEGYFARSVFKLKEINEKFNILRHQDNVLDIGSAPGSFLQYISEIAGKKGSIIGIDIKPIAPFSMSGAVKTFVCNIFDEKKLKEILKNRTFNVITADLAPKTSGIRAIDQANSLNLNKQVLKIADMSLENGGNLITKIFQGKYYKEFLKEIKKKFIHTHCYKPKSSRDRSYEIFIIGKNKI